MKWRLKILAKILMSRLPVAYGAWSRLSLFKHGHMEDPEYVHRVVTERLRDVGLPPDAGFVAMELGPGDSLSSCLVTHALGASRTVLVDVGDFARHDVRPYGAMIEYLQTQGFDMSAVATARDRDEVLEGAQGEYHTRGLESLRTLASESVDFVWSQAVLEHVRHAEFDDVMSELRRIVRPTAVMSHRVDLKDHLGGALNNLRFSRPVWESDFMVKSGFYTNRLRLQDMDRAFRRAGFDPEYVSVDRWTALPTPRKALSPEFRDLPDEQLLVSGFNVVLRPVSNAGRVADLSDPERLGA